MIRKRQKNAYVYTDNQRLDIHFGQDGWNIVLCVLEPRIGSANKVVYSTRDSVKIPTGADEVVLNDFLSLHKLMRSKPAVVDGMLRSTGVETRRGRKPEHG